MNLSEEDKKKLLTSARDSIRSIFENVFVPQIDYKSYPSLQNNSGVFVTLRIGKGLRGCIGYVVTEMTLFDAVCDASKQSAFNDPRFPPLTKEEFEKIKIEISVLSPFKLIKDYSEIKIGEHGILLNEKENKALLLPQVASENNYNVEQFLCALCQKASLNIFTWQKKKLSLNVFTAEVFSEDEFSL